MATPTFTKAGAKATTPAKLDKAVFDVDIKNHELVKQAYVAYQANGRENLAKTLKRGEVRGGGKKPWKQKGTGRARFGSIRVPIWRGGGITFGPLGKENYSKQLPKNAKRTAIRQALTMQATSGNVMVIDAFEAKDSKTKAAASLLNKIGASGRILLVVENKTTEIDQATRNLKDTKVVQAQYVNVADAMDASTIVIEKKALEAINAWLGTKEAKK